MVVGALSWNAATITLLTVSCTSIAIALLVWLVLAIRKHKKVAPDNRRENKRRPPDTISIEGDLPRFVPRPKATAWADDNIDAARAPFVTTPPPLLEQIVAHPPPMPHAHAHANNHTHGAVLPTRTKTHGRKIVAAAAGTGAAVGAVSQYPFLSPEADGDGDLPGSIQPLSSGGGENSHLSNLSGRSFDPVPYPLAQLAALADGQAASPGARVAQEQLNMAAWNQFLTLTTGSGEPSPARPAESKA